MSRLTQESLGNEAAIFSALESQHQEASLYGVTDGKAIGTYLEQKFKLYLKEKYDFVEGNAASGIDFPELLVDIKVTSTKQPQSSCPFKSARQKIFGLGYSLIIFVYEKLDNSLNRTTINMPQPMPSGVIQETIRTASLPIMTGIAVSQAGTDHQDVKHKWLVRLLVQF